MDEKVLQTLQKFVEGEGLDSKEHMAELATMDPLHPRYQQLIARLCEELGMTPEAA